MFVAQLLEPFLILSLVAQFGQVLCTKNVMIVLAGIFIGIFVVNFSSAQWWNHVPCSVEESDDARLLWDFSVATDRNIPANRPDII